MPPDDNRLRIADAEREAAIAALSRQFSEGRLTPDEFSERCAAVGAALTRADLKPIFIDLPVNPAGFTITDPVVSDALQRQRAQFTAQRAAQERRQARIHFLETLFKRLQYGSAAAAAAALVMAFYSLGWGSQDFVWIIAIVVCACVAMISAALRAFVRKR